MSGRPEPARVRRPLTGWGRTAPSVAQVVAACDEDDVVKCASAPPARGIVARGLGRSYNDAAQNGGGVVIDVTGHSRVLTVDVDAAAVRVAAGTSFADLLAALVPQGLFPAVTPGTKFVTVGGAIASDVHGKNHHVEGSFADFVTSIRLWTPADGVVEVNRGADPELFWATVGGMGLTGVVLDATLRMRRIETSRMVVDTDRMPDLDAALAVMAEEDDDHPYSVAWIDCQVGGRHLGRSVLTRARHADVTDLPAGDRPGALSLDDRRTLPAPPWAPTALVNRFTVRAFNEVWFRKAPRRERGRLVPYGPFFYPLDFVSGWNRLYGPRGFIQYQLLVPFGAEDTLRETIEMLAASNAASFLAVLKRFGPANQAPLSFPAPGWTLALDLAVGPPDLAALLDDLDERVVAAGGRCYLAKDARLRPDLVEAMYPRLGEWRGVQRRVDPIGVLESDLARRLDLLGRGRRS